MPAKYHRRHPLIVGALHGLDAALAALPRKRVPLPAAPRSILLCNPAHMGDVLITTALLRELRLRFPDTAIDMMIGRWSAPIVAHHSGVRALCFIDHPALDRSATPARDKARRYRADLAHARRWLDARHFDLAVCCYGYSPSFIPLLRRARETALIGFDSAGFGPLLDQAYPKGEAAHHEVQHQARLFEPWLGPVRGVEHYRPWLPQFAPATRGDYVVLHPGAGSAHKEWTPEGWRALIATLAARAIPLVMTGTSPREAALAQSLCAHSAVENRVGSLDFAGFITTLAGARAVVAVNSLAAHAAAALDVPTVSIASGIGVAGRWTPLGSQVREVRRPLPCSPCHTRVCAARPCVTEISAGEVLRALDEVMR